MRSHVPAAIDAFLAQALSGASVGYPADWNQSDTQAAVVSRVLYHGIAGLIARDPEQLSAWPQPARAAVRDQAIAQTMWELSHREVLRSLTEAFAEAGITALMLKGTAVAYDVYEDPPTRARGDTDLLIALPDLARARETLGRLGFRHDRTMDEDKHPAWLQESWSMTRVDGSSHAIDLHWQAFNAPAMRQVLSWDRCVAGAEALPRLAPHALRLDRPAMLLHACAHRAIHITAPYMVGEATFYGGDRLIWAYDIHLLAGKLTKNAWSSFCDLAVETGLAPICLNALLWSEGQIGSPMPESVRERLEGAKGAAASTYLEAHQFRRAVMDLRSIEGLAAKIGYVRARLFPPGDFMRGKYPSMRRSPIAFLHARRIVDLIRKRSLSGSE